MSKPRREPAPVQQTIIHVHAGKFPHLFHFALTILTCGLWLPIWILHRLFSSR